MPEANKITVLNGDIFFAVEPMSKVMALKMPVKTSFALARMANLLSAKLQDAEMVRNQLINQYGTLVEGSRKRMEVKEGSEHYEDFTEKVDELMAMEVVIETQKVVLPTSALDGQAIEAAVLLPLLKFIDLE